jgi:DNA-binding CsgD family transcriptional regulator
MNPFQSLIDPPKDLPCRPDGKPMVISRPPRQHTRRSRVPNPWGLSPTEAAVARRLATLSTADIGRALGISDKTVNCFVARCKDKMGVETRSAVVRLWDEHMGVAQ